jgi:dienelactone hydrolase
MTTTWKKRHKTARSTRRRLARLAAFSLAGCVGVAATVSCASAVAATQPATANGRGTVISVTPVRALPTAAAVAAELKSDGFAAGPARYGVRAYRLTYRTVDAAGRATTASGLLALPVGGPRSLRAVSFTHGTESYRGDAPSVQPTGFDPAPAYAYASAGFATAEPDYLGLGTGPGPHPWMDVPSETTAALDLLRAARTYVDGQGRSLQRKVMVTGFSQGASAAIGLGQALQAGADPWFRLGALAPVSGAYDFQGAELPAILNGELIRLNPSPQLGAKYTVMYAAYTLVGFNRVHPIAGMPGKIFRAPYAATIETLLDGNHTGAQLLAGTPATLSQLVTPYGLNLLRHPSGGLAAALRSADSVCTSWAPRVPVRLYLASGDEQAVNANTEHCQAGFAARGVKVPTVNLGTPDNQGSRHYGSNAAATPRIARWFLQLSR